MYVYISGYSIHIYTYTLGFSYFKNVKFSLFRLGGSSSSCPKFINIPFFGHTAHMPCLPKICHIIYVYIYNIYIYNIYIYKI